VGVVLRRGCGWCRKGTDAGRALCFVRNSQSSRVKMSLVTAAMEKRARRALQRASMRAVLPEPTGLEALVALFFLELRMDVSRRDEHTLQCRQ
jgi:hypothetical protein